MKDEYDIPLDTFDAESQVEESKERNWNHTRRSNLRGRTPLPILQLSVLCFIRLAEPIAYTQIFPYINQMIENLDVTDQRSKIGFYSGLVDSLFAVFQLLTVFQWARLSDRIGRKPVLLLGLCGVAFSTCLFGFSSSFLWAIVARSLAGALSGNVAVVESVISEITDETNQEQAFPLKGVSWGLGSIIGPMIGGNLVNSSERWPKTFGQLEIFRQYPYLLPCITTAAVAACSMILGVLYLKESLPSKQKGLNATPVPSGAKVSVKDILCSRTVRSVLRNYFLFSVMQISFDVVFVLMAYTPVHLGGLGRSPEEIGYALAFSGIVLAQVQMFLFPVLQRRLGNLVLYRCLMMIWPLLFVLLPMLNFIAPSQVRTNWLWIGIVGVLSLARCGNMCYSVNDILIKNAAPSRDALGATFGLGQTIACVARAGAPAFVSSLFAFSKESQLLDGNFVWVVMFSFGLMGVWSTFHVIDGSVRQERRL